MASVRACAASNEPDLPPAANNPRNPPAYRVYSRSPLTGRLEAFMTHDDWENLIAFGAATFGLGVIVVLLLVQTGVL